MSYLTDTSFYLGMLLNSKIYFGCEENRHIVSGHLELLASILVLGL